jgi:hypothetical protein
MRVYQSVIDIHFCQFAIPRMRVYQPVIDIHFCQFARLPNAIKADKLPLVVELQPRRLVHGNASSGVWGLCDRLCPAHVTFRRRDITAAKLERLRLVCIAARGESALSVPDSTSRW